MIQKVVFPGRFESLAQIADLVQKISHDCGFDSKAIYAIETAVDEACSNIIEHAYGGEGNGEIECTFSSNEDGLTITLMDNGQPFDPYRVDVPDLDAPCEDRPGHGLGIYFMQHLMDEVVFDFSGNKNTLTMVKRKESCH